MVSEQTILTALRTVLDPDLHKDIVSLGFVKNLTLRGGNVKFDIELTTPACPVKSELQNEATEKVKALPGVEKVEVNMTSNVRSRAVSAPQTIVLKGVKNTIAVASGKGGVGKSTVAANLALALAKTGAQVGLLDTDIYGPSMPIMFGLKGQPTFTQDEKILPLEAHGIKLMSMGFLTTDDTPVIWRGPMVHNMLSQFLRQIEWGELDYLVLDLPPGTGDAQLTLTQQAPLSGAIIVTTPQDVSLIDARKGLKMFQQVKVPVLGIIENMSYFICSHCGERTEIFRHGGGKRTAEALGVPYLGEIPIDPAVAACGDTGTPIVAADPNAKAAQALMAAAKLAAAQISIASMEAEPAPALAIEWKK